MANKKIVLAIDDNIQQLNEFKTILIKNYDLRVVKSASEAINFLNKNNADIILLDIEMPDISGFEFLDDIKKVPSHADVPVIIISGNNGQEFFKRAGESEAAGVLTKPVNADRLTEAIEKAVF